MPTPYQPRTMPASPPNVGDEPFFNAARDGRLLIKKCGACGQVHYHPRAMCPFCMSDRVEWIEAKGMGTVYTFSVTRRSGPTAYAIAYVTLDEGISMMTNIVDCDLDDVRIGQRVKLTFKPTDGEAAPAPCFTPA